MNIYVLKGILVDANKGVGNTEFKERIFEAISYPGFVHNTYDVIGVEFGLGLLELPEATMDKEDALVKIQVWNLNERKNFVLNWRSFLKGSRFGVVSWKKEHEDSITNLVAIISDCTDRCPSMNLGLVIQQEGEYSPREFAKTLEERTDIQYKFVEDIEALVVNLILASIRGERIAFILPVSSLDEIRHVDLVESPFTNYLTRASDELVEFLGKQGYFINEKNEITIKKEDFIYKLDLNKLQLYACNNECLSCKKYPCSEAFKRICVVLESTKRGWVSDELGLLKSDLFFLSIIYSIMEESLPHSVTSQFPKKKACSKRR